MQLSEFLQKGSLVRFETVRPLQKILLVRNARDGVVRNYVRKRNLNVAREMIPFKVLKEFKTIYVRNGSSNYELRSKIVLKPRVKEPALLITKVFTKNSEQIETTKLGRIPLEALHTISFIVDESIQFITNYMNNGE